MSDRLLEDAQRDWTALGRERLLVTPLSRYRQGTPIKLAEGTVGLVFDQVRSVARSSLRGKVGAALLRPSLRGVRDRLDYRAFGAVPLLGVEGGVFIGHGRSDGAGVAGALRSAYQAGRSGMLGALKSALEGSAGAGAPDGADAG